ncbi:MAG: hypothetical protein NZ455_13380 [Bacteroidia bacterium]|nr:hypothetical protein [Bacteroidia bacterium]MDW8347726.1 hypothetical protein [Bacteroidia bacterium]
MGVSLAALGSGYYALRVRFGATLRYALPNGMLRIPHATLYLDVLYYLYAHIRFTLFKIGYQRITRLYLKYMDFLYPFNPD